MFFNACISQVCSKGQQKLRGENIAVFWVPAPCRLVDVHRRFRGDYCLHHRGDCTAEDSSEMPVNLYQTSRSDNPVDSHLHTRRSKNLISHFIDRCKPSCSTLTYFPNVFSSDVSIHPRTLGSLIRSRVTSHLQFPLSVTAHKDSTPTHLQLLITLLQFDELEFGIYLPPRCDTVRYEVLLRREITYTWLTILATWRTECFFSCNSNGTDRNTHAQYHPTHPRANLHVLMLLVAAGPQCSSKADFVQKNLELQINQ
jgi:hypothetical protein